MSGATGTRSAGGRASKTAAGLPAWLAMLHALGEAAWIVDARGLALAGINRAALDLLAISEADAQALGAAALIGTPEDAAFWGDVRAGHVGQLESQPATMAADGRLPHVTRRIAPLAARAGTRPTHFLVVVRDRSEQLHEQLDRETLLAELQATLESTADGILVTDLAGRIRAFNQRFAVVWALPKDLLSGTQDDAVFDWMRRCVVDPHAYQCHLAALQESVLMRAQQTVQLLSGATRRAGQRIDPTRRDRDAARQARRSRGVPLPSAEPRRGSARPHAPGPCHAPGADRPTVPRCLPAAVPHRR